ncbi:MAG: Hpt domain-containing protein [Nannocystaceae bacterium]
MPEVVVDISSLKDLDSLTPPGEPSLVVEIIDAYLEESETDVANMRAAAVDGDGDRLGRAAHRLKGSSANVGAFTLVDRCAALEELARTGARHRYAEEVEAVLEIFERSLVLLKRERAAAE